MGASGFEQMYPHIARWVQSYGWIEIGADLYSQSLVRALDEVLQTLDAVLAERMKEFYA